MNVSSANVTVVVHYRDSFLKAVTKNVIVVALGISINYINANLIHTFRRHQILKLNPRYILFIHLVTNDMIQLTVSISLFTFTYIFYTINVSVCCLIILAAVFTTQNTPLNLACMAVECYIAICIPLRHGQLCTVKRTHVVIGLIWAMSVLSVLPDLFIILATEPLQFFHSRVFCRRDYVFRSSYSLRKRDASHILFLVVVWLVLFCAYFRILFAAKAADGDAKKARNTILLHGFQLLLCMLTYIAPALKKALFEWFPKQYSHSLFVCYIIIQILPRFVSPIVYGLRDQTFRRYLKKYFLSRGINPQTTLKVYT
ncbi:odorant receptor 131-2-like [Diretmus argenteus]